jgi:hypothetical protein
LTIWTIWLFDYSTSSIILLGLSGWGKTWRYQITGGPLAFCWLQIRLGWLKNPSSLCDSRTRKNTVRCNWLVQKNSQSPNSDFAELPIIIPSNCPISAPKRCPSPKRVGPFLLHRSQGKVVFASLQRPRGWTFRWKDMK